MVNINIEIPEELHRDVKVASVLDGSTLKQYVIDTLATELEREGLDGQY